MKHDEAMCTQETSCHKLFSDHEQLVSAVCREELPDPFRLWTRVGFSSDLRPRGPSCKALESFFLARAKARFRSAAWCLPSLDLFLGLQHAPNHILRRW